MIAFVLHALKYLQEFPFIELYQILNNGFLNKISLLLYTNIAYKILKSLTLTHVSL